jgi:hypothetical protein
MPAKLGEGEKMKKLILSFAVLATVVLGMLPVAAQKRAAERRKTREVSIYVLENIERNGVSDATLVEVKRRVNARTPVAGAVRALLDDSNFIYALRLVSARVENGKAYINLAYDEDEIECCWGANMLSFFYDSIEKTVLQFPEVKEVRVCANGIENFLVRDPELQRKCPKN